MPAIKMTEVPTTIKNKELVEKRREQIVLAAIELFSKKGFHGATLRELAEESGLSYGNIYDYVGSKEDIFSLIHDFVANLVMETLLSSIENISDPIERLRRIVRGEFNVMDQWADAILLIYQESHILSDPYLHKLLGKERQHLELIESAIYQAVSSGRLRDCNARMMANLIKSMIDSWVIKRWDMRGFVTRPEAEKGIFELVLNGLLTREDDYSGITVKHKLEERHDYKGLQGKSVLIANGGTLLGSAVCNACLARGANIAVQSEPVTPTRENPVICNDPSTGTKLFPADHYGPLSTDLFRQIESDWGPADIFIQDLGVGIFNEDLSSQEASAERLTDNLKAAEKLAAMFVTEQRKQPHRIIFIAPWGWDKFADPFRFKTVRAGILAITKTLSASLAPGGVNVNCILPGYIRATRPSPLEKKMRTELMRLIPSGCLGEATDVAETVNFLISDSTKYLTGQVLEVSGGLELDHYQ
jgi:AcrR family transcriptional regulator/NAD(P)-dependent dehydrogenase (short-subunit alcohol dehydrogenase family)